MIGEIMVLTSGFIQTRWSGVCKKSLLAALLVSGRSLSPTHW
jgi:hypothetical protein